MKKNSIGSPTPSSRGETDHTAYDDPAVSSIGYHIGSLRVRLFFRKGQSRLLRGMSCRRVQGYIVIRHIRKNRDMDEIKDYDRACYRPKDAILWPLRTIFSDELAELAARP